MYYIVRDTETKFRLNYFKALKELRKSFYTLDEILASMPDLAKTNLEKVNNLKQGKSCPVKRISLGSYAEVYRLTDEEIESEIMADAIRVEHRHVRAQAKAFVPQELRDEELKLRRMLRDYH